MELSDELLEEIGAYLAGRLTAAEKARFEARMQADVGLRAEVATQREIKQGLLFLNQKERFKAMHADLHQRDLLESAERKPETRPVQQRPTIRQIPVRPLWTYAAVAASVVLLLGLGWFVYQNRATEQAKTAQNAQTFDRFFSANLKPSPLLPADPDRLAAPQAETRPNADSLRLSAAIGALRNGETEAARRQLEALARATPGHWSASAEWYLALAYLKANDPTQTQRLAKRIATLDGHPYQREARALLRQLAATGPAARP